MSNNLRKNLSLLKILAKTSPKSRREIIDKSDPDLVASICESCFNFCKGSVKLNSQRKKQLRKYRKQMIQLGSVKNLRKNCKREKKIINKTSAFLPLLINEILKFLNKK